MAEFPTVPPHLRQITVPPRPTQTRQNLVQRVGGLLQRGLTAWGGLLAGDPDPEASDEINRAARQQALLAAAAALASGEGLEALPRAALLGRQTAEEHRAQALQRQRERQELEREAQRRQRVEGLLSGGDVFTDEGARQLVATGLLFDDPTLVNTGRNILDFLEPGTPIQVRDGGDTVLLDPRTRQEIARFRGERRVARVDTGNEIQFVDEETGEVLHRHGVQQDRRLTAFQAASLQREREQEQRERQEQRVFDMAYQMAARTEAANPDFLTRVLTSAFPGMDPIRVGAIAFRAHGQAQKDRLDRRAQEADVQWRHNRAAGESGSGGGQASAARRADQFIATLRAQGVSDEEIEERARRELPASASMLVPDRLRNQGSNDFGRYGVAVPR